MESALIVPVPVAEPIVGPWRECHDPSAALGVPAHITVMYPFVDPERLDADLIGRLDDLFSGIPAFRFRLDSLGWFEPAALWLAPNPSVPFRALTEAVMAEWPDLKPYGGTFYDIVPHLTIGESDATEQLGHAASEIAASLPLSCHATEVALIVGSDQSPWRTVATLRMGTAG